MDKRHYFTQAVDISEIDTITRTISDGKVIGYSINETINLELDTDEYKLNITIHTKEPSNWKGKVIEKSETEVWTKDGIYLKKSADENDDGIYIKDFFENIDEEYQGIYLDGLKSKSLDTTIIEKLAENILENDINGMEFYIHSDGEGIEDEVVAYMNGHYYVNSNNFYHPHLIGTSDNIYTDWKIPASDYSNLTNNSDPSNGRTFNLYLPSNKLVYLLWRDGINASSTSYLDTTDSPLQYIDTITIEGLSYQVYINILYIYSESGTIEDLTSEKQQVLEVKNAFNHEDLKGKLVKVW